MEILEGLGSGLQLSTVQLPSAFTKEKKEQALRYLENYTKNMLKVHVYWEMLTNSLQNCVGRNLKMLNERRLRARTGLESIYRPASF